MRPNHSATAIALASSLLAGAMLTPCASSQNPKTWSRTYGGPVDGQGLYDLRALPGGRLVAAGHTASFGPGSFSWLLNLDLATGDVGIQSASSSSFGGITDGAKVAADGGALFLGRNVIDIFVKHDAWVMRADPAGNILWSHLFSTPGAGRFFLFDAQELDDGSWIAAGATSVTDVPPQHAWIVRMSSTGSVLWQAEYGAGIWDTARSVTATSDGGFAVAGWTNSSGAGFDDVWVMKIDSVGAIQWQKTFGGFDTDQAESIVQLADGGYAIAGSTNSLTPSGHAPWVLRLDAAGNLVWHEVVDDGVWGDLGAIAKTNDRKLVVVGRVSQPSFPTNDLWSCKLDPADGHVIWQRRYEGKSGDFGSAVMNLGDAGYVLGGTWAWGLPGESVWLLRTSNLGNLGCDLVTSPGFALTSPRITVQDGIALRTAATAQVGTVGIQFGSSQATVLNVCR